ncbi:CREB/ATF bZIP transcription factor isoform 2-T5 [Thomomys bottae]
MRHSLTKLLAASGRASPAGSDSPAPAAACSLPRAAAASVPGRQQSPGDEGPVRPGRGSRGSAAAAAVAVARAPSPSPEEMEDEAAAGVREEDPEDMDFLSGLELADLLDPRQPDWHLEAGHSSPGPLSSSGGGSDHGGPWRGDDDDDAAAAAEMQRFSDLLQRLLNGIGGGGGGGDGGGGGGGGGGGEKRRRKSPGAGGGGGASGNDTGQAATKSPRKAAAAAARLNRLKKKEYVMGLESRVRGLAAENQELRAENRELGRRVQALQEESRYLRAVLANETGLARLLSRLSGVGLRLTTSLFRDSPAGDHDYALPVGKQPPELPEEDDAAGGVCLHVDKDKVSVEFCSACARKASSSLKM